MKVCAVIPAAGRGTRLGIDVPKILAPVIGEETIWSIMRAKLGSVCAHINVVMSPWGEPVFRSRLTVADLEMVSISMQEKPIGMGDAVFCALPVFSQFDVLLVVWGDQVNISRDTLVQSLALHAGLARSVVIPTVRLMQPYVEYRFTDAGLLDRILETREGDVCAAGGLADVGAFVLSVQGLAEEWSRYLSVAHTGAKTGEINFLPFLCHLSKAGWNVRALEIFNAVEACGINTRDDLLEAGAYIARLKAGERI